MKTLSILNVLCLTLLNTPLAQAEQSQLGRLFFTPEQRQQFNYGKFKEGDNTTPDSLMLNGIVQKNGGTRTAWINGVPQKIGLSDEHNPSSVPLSIPNKARAITVKVGQQINVDTGSAAPR
jgi:hypothetical protein